MMFAWCSNPKPVLIDTVVLLVAGLLTYLAYANALPVGYALALVGTPVFLLHLAHRRLIGSIHARLSALLATEPRSLDEDLAQLSLQWDRLERRAADLHPTSGLRMREEFLAHMARFAQGSVGVVSLLDFDRLTAFDPVKGEQALLVTANRLRSMLPAKQLVAQVDRGQIAIWFGDVPAAQASAELNAIAYALGDRICDGDLTLTPQIRTRLERFHSSAGFEASVFLSRLLASAHLSDNASPVGVVATSNSAMSADDEFSLEQDLRLAVMRQELRLEFQPLVDAEQSRVCGAEALIRWAHPVRGAISPSTFIPIAERVGLSGEIGVWALNCAIREARRWAATEAGGLRVAVNISAMQLETDDLPILIERTLARHGLCPTGLEIELTESLAAKDAGQGRAIFDALQAMGTKVTLDDFGTGFSGFSSLRQFTFDKIKIDREFITAVHNRPINQAICQSMIALGQGLGVEVLAEGVETIEEYHWLRQHGCRYFQGYYFGRPMRGSAFRALIDGERPLTNQPDFSGCASIGRQGAVAS